VRSEKLKVKSSKKFHGTLSRIRLGRWLAAIVFALLASRAVAQPVPAARVSALGAEDRRAPTTADVSTLRLAARGRDPQTARLAVRALGRLERPALIPDILPALRHALAELRSEAANALAQAAQGWSAGAPLAAPTVDSVLSALIARLGVEGEASVRAALAESIGRLPFRNADHVARAEAALVEAFEAGKTVTDRLGTAKGFEAFARASRSFGPPGGAAVEALRSLLAPPAPGIDPLRDARVRRLALEALIVADGLNDHLVASAAADPDPQVRRLAMKAAWTTGRGLGSLARGLDDPAAMVRLEALRGTRERGGDQACASSARGLGDAETKVVLLALDQLAGCGASAEAIARLEDAVTDLSQAGSPRGWHRAAHAIVSLATAAPDRAAPHLGQFVGSSIWQLRMYAARAAAVLKDRARLDTLADDRDDNVVEAAIEGLAASAGHAADARYVAALSRTGYQAVRAAAIALDGSPNKDLAVPALGAALGRLVAEGRANSTDARTALTRTLTTLGAAPAPPRPVRSASGVRVTNAGKIISTILTSDALRRLAAPRARVTIARVGTFELALITAEAPATVLRFANLAESGYYNGLTFHRVAPNFVIQGGSPGANEYVGHPDYMRDELGLWPHVRGAVGISTRGRDTGDAQIFIDLVDNPRLDHQYTVFAQVLNGIEVIDRILEGDVIEKVEIVP